MTNVCRDDINNLKGLLRDKNYSKAADRLEAVRWKLVIARHYAGLAEKQEETIATITTIDQEWLKLQLIAEAHTMCVAHTLHTIGDISAQLLNDSILDLGNNRINRARYVSLDNVINQLISPNAADGYAIIMDGLKQSSAYSYLGAFVNTIKHRSLIDSTHETTWREGEPIIQGIRFKRFDYGIQTFQPTFAHTIYGQFLNEIEDVVCTLVQKLLVEAAGWVRRP